MSIQTQGISKSSRGGGIWRLASSTCDGRDTTTDGPLPGGSYTVITTSGHVDEVVRFVGPKTILLAEVANDGLALQTDPGIHAITQESQ